MVTIRRETLPPRTFSIRSIDVGTKTQTRTGGITVVSKKGGTTVSRTSGISRGQQAAILRASINAEKQRVETAARKAEEERIVAIKKANELMKQNRERESLVQRRRQQEAVKIIKQQQLLIQRGAKITTQTSKDIRSGDNLIITRTKSGGNQVVKIENLTKGTTRFNIFGIPSGGGGSRQLSGITIETPGKLKETIATQELPPIKLTSEITQKQKQNIKNKLLSDLIKFDEEVRKENSKSETRRNINRRKGVIKLIQEGQLPAAVIAAFDIAAEKFLTGSDFLKVGLIGGETLNDAEIQQGGKILSDIALFAGLAPLTTTTGELIAKLPSNTIIKFGGKQTTKDGKIITADGPKSAKAFGEAIVKTLSAE